MNDESEQGDSNEQAESIQAEGSESYSEDGNIAVAEEKPPINRGTMAMFIILIVGAAGLYLMYKRTLPRPASAAVNVGRVDATQTISKFLSGGNKSIRSMEQLLKNTEKVVQTFLTYPSTTQVPLSDLRTNPFRQRTEVAKPANTGPDQDALDKKRREEERLTVLKAVQGLQLQSVMFSEARKACMINNTLYREGQSIDNFTIEKISPTSVVVKNGPYRFELRMQR